ncbi:RNA 2',3'-cyclic phosphodiesterase [Shewanella sp. YIC-542]|uniref:RNA 2',3'-cyclic phosphodiesterase n=1 Tax=Shewanella mytili TaxID=3377111 RepID=UPI00398E3632
MMKTSLKCTEFPRRWLTATLVKTAMDAYDAPINEQREQRMSNLPAQRLFLGFAVPARQTRQLQQLQQRCLTQMPKARPVSADNLHLTLAFLGQTTDNIRQQLVREIPALPLKEFVLTLTPLEHWPKPRILCLTGVATEPLLTLANAAAALSARLALAKQALCYRPHVTLLRHVNAAPDAISAAPLCLSPRHLNLYASISQPEGVRYQVLQRWPLLA